MRGRRANVTDEQFGCQPAKKNEEHYGPYNEEEKFAEHSGHSSDVKVNAGGSFRGTCLAALLFELMVFCPAEN